MSRWLLVGAGMCFLLVSANILTLGYAIIGFEAMLVIYWLRRGQSNLAIGRLFLGILTAAGFVLVELSPNQGFMSGQDLLGLVLWLRLGVYPFIEVNQVKAWRAEEKLIYLGVTLIIGVYLMMRVTVAPLPQFVWWLAVVMMLINGLLVWLSEDRQSQLTHLILTEILLLLLVVPLASGVGSAAGLALILSLIALWVTPHLGRPNFTQTAWLWPYLPAATATLTLIGLPYSLGWLMRTEVYRLLLAADNLLLILMVFLAEILALSGLVRYWQTMWQVENGDNRRLAIGIAVMVPFLIPGLGPFILDRMLRQTLPEVDLAHSSPVLVTLVVTILGAFGVTYFRVRLFEMLRIRPARLTEWLQLQWLAELGVQGWTRFGKGILRLDVILEGQYYIGWAIFVTLVGALLIFLGA